VGYRESSQGPVGYRESSQGPVLRDNIQLWERTEARLGVRLLGRAMLGQTVVAAIIYGFVGTDWTTLPNRLQPGPKLPR